MIYASKCFRGEMDITPVFGTVVLGSNPGGSTSKNSLRAIFVYASTNSAGYIRIQKNTLKGTKYVSDFYTNNVLNCG